MVVISRGIETEDMSPMYFRVPYKLNDSDLNDQISIEHIYAPYTSQFIGALREHLIPFKRVYKLQTMYIGLKCWVINK